MMGSAENIGKKDSSKETDNNFSFLNKKHPIDVHYTNFQLVNNKNNIEKVFEKKKPINFSILLTVKSYIFFLLSP